MEKKSQITPQQYQFEIKDTKWPIVYSPVYNIGFCGLEKLHPFDSGKWGRIFTNLKVARMLRDDTIFEPMEATEEELLCVHTQEYINNLKWSVNVARITEVAILLFLPNFLVQSKVLKPLRFQTSGTIMAARLAIERGWAINIGGGFHHCSADRGGGFCAYADITLAVKFAMEHYDKVTNVMIVDLDAHQGNGHERDFMNNSHVYILDVYNREIYPYDTYAKGAIKRKVELRSFTKDSDYLKLVQQHIDCAFEEFTPHLVVYNAGTDILEHDPLGNLSITPKGIMERDKIVFEKCRSENVPVFMVTSGGYLPGSAKVVSDSILNLWRLHLISCEGAEQLYVDNAVVEECPGSSL
ncbi:hypothetical protein BsWGS_13946 [Bradybaena similaris]